MNQTLAIIKPDAMEKGNMDNIKKDILDGGFNILKECGVTISNTVSEIGNTMKKIMG